MTQPGALSPSPFFAPSLLLPLSSSPVKGFHSPLHLLDITRNRARASGRQTERCDRRTGSPRENVDNGAVPHFEWHSVMGWSTIRRTNSVFSDKARFVVRSVVWKGLKMKITFQLFTKTLTTNHTLSHNRTPYKAWHPGGPKKTTIFLPPCTPFSAFDNALALQTT